MDNIVSVNVANFITVGLMAMVFVFLARTVQVKTGLLPSIKI